MKYIPTEIVRQFAHGNGAIFVGAELSQGVGLPSWSDIVRELTAELEDCPPDIDYREIAQYYDIEYGRNRLVQKLRDLLSTINVQPTPVHQALLQLPTSTIFTTNYDNLLEKALRATKQPFTTVVSNVDASFWTTGKLQLVKLHGDLDQPDSIVITSEDYERIGAKKPSLARLLATTLQTRTVLFLGYSATDPDLRLILTQIRDEIRDSRTHNYARNLYTMQFGVSKLVTKSLERRGLKVIDLGQEPENTNRDEVLLTWLQEFAKRVTTEIQCHQSVAAPQPKTAVRELSSEIQIWLNAMGYNVTGLPGNELCLDLEANLQRGLEEQNVMVRCLAGEISVSHLEAFAETLATHQMNKGWIVSDRRVPTSSQTYAEEHFQIRPFSLTDFVTQIFGPYFKRLRQLVEENNILGHYVDLTCYRRVVDRTGTEIDRDDYNVIDDYVDDWLKARDANHLSILGEFGSGKTWFCQHYTYRQLERYLKDPVHERIPILISLRDYIKQVEITSLIRNLLDEQGVQLSGGLEAFEELNRQGKLLLIFDGFDEMAVKVDYQTVVDYFWEMAKVVVPSSKAILTCRTPYFRFATEVEKVMRGEELGRNMIVIRPPQFEVLYLKPFTHYQIHEAVTLRYGTEVADAILSNADMVNLAHQPVLIETLIEALPDIKTGTPINKTEVYRLAVERWLDRDISTGRTFMDRSDKLFFMRELAWEMFLTSKFKFHYKELPKRINQHFGLEQIDEKDHYDYDIRAKSFLQRDAYGHYRFTHRSLVEFFVAQKLCEEITKGEYDNVLHPNLSMEVYHFLSDILPYDIDLTDFCEAKLMERNYSTQKMFGYFLSALARDDLVYVLIRALRFSLHARIDDRHKFDHFFGDRLKDIFTFDLGLLSKETIPVVKKEISYASTRKDWKLKKELERVIKAIESRYQSEQGK